MWFRNINKLPKNKYFTGDMDPPVQLSSAGHYDATRVKIELLSKKRTRNLCKAERDFMREQAYEQSGVVQTRYRKRQKLFD